MKTYNRSQLDKILINLCDLVIERQKNDPEKWGLVGAAFIDRDTGYKTTATSIKKSGKWQHAERTAINIFKNRFGYTPEHSIMVVTLSPCSDTIEDRFGTDCESLIEDLPDCQVYVGYRDPSQTLSNPDFEIAYTNNTEIQQICRELADFFLDAEDHALTESLKSLGITAAAILTSVGVLSQAINMNQDYIQQTIDNNFRAPENTEFPKRSTDDPTPVRIQRPDRPPEITEDVKKVVEFLQRPLAKELLESAQKHGIRGMELLQLIAQCAHETANFTTLREHGTRQDFMQQYDRRHNPETAEILGNERPGDGAKYYGRGFIQLTGRDNYRQAGRALNLPLETHPELVEKDPKIAAETTIWFWKTHVAAKTNNFEDTREVTKPINRTLHGIEDREANFRGLKQFLNILNFKNSQDQSKQ